MNSFLGEYIGTAVLITLGGGVVANVVLNKTKGNNSGWIVITFGWAMAVFCGVIISAPYSGAHLNPAVTLSLFIVGKFSASNVFSYLLAQFLGAMTGALIVWLIYRNHFQETSNMDDAQAVFCTSPNIRNYFTNFLTEVMGTFILILAVLYMAAPDVGLGAINALPVSFVVLALGLSLGGPTGYAINPARDLGPRIIHALLPIKNKKGFDLSYAWVPVFGPFVGAILAALLFLVLNR